MISLFCVHMSVLPQASAKEKEGNLYNACLHCLSSPCADQPLFWPRSWVWFLTTQAILMIHWWCNQLRQLMLMNCIQYRSHATTAGGVKTYLWNRQLFDIKIRKRCKYELSVRSCIVLFFELDYRSWWNFPAMYMYYWSWSICLSHDASQAHMSSLFLQWASYQS